MPNKKRRLIALLIDRSGSMQKVAADTEGGLKTFLEQQVEADQKLTDEGVENETHVVLADFNDTYQRVYGPVELAEAPEYKLVATGSTALRDSIAQLVRDVEVGKSWMLHKGALDEAVTVVILTDGDDNVSTASREETRKLIEAKQEAGWTFLFLGANQDAILTGGELGISRDRAVTYNADTASGTVLRSVGAVVANSYVANSSVVIDDQVRSQVQ